MLIIENLTVSYGDHQVLDQLSLSLEPGQIHGLVGLNGSGKTTLLNTIAGYKKQESGSITFELHSGDMRAHREKPLHPASETTDHTSHPSSGLPDNTPNRYLEPVDPASTLSPETTGKASSPCLEPGGTAPCPFKEPGDNTPKPWTEPGDASLYASAEHGGVETYPFRGGGGPTPYSAFETRTGKSSGKHLDRSIFSFLETENYFYSKITGREYLQLFKTPAHSKTIDEWNGIFDLPLDELIDGYSSGMKKKLALLGVLRQMKPLVILDEPFNGLDIESTRLLSMIITSLKEQHHTVIVTSHILDSLTGICDFIHYLKDGKICFSRSQGDFGNLEADIFREVDQDHEIRLRSLLG